MNEIRLRVQDVFRRYGYDKIFRSRLSETVAADSKRRRLRPRSAGNSSYRSPLFIQKYPPLSGRHNHRATGIEVARFGLLSIATLPFSLWLLAYSYCYFYRIDICREALTNVDEDISDLSQTPNMTTLIGREKKLEEVRTILSEAPLQIVVVAGANESGKSRFISEILRTVDPRRGITFIQMAQVVDSLSTLAQSLVLAFDLQWLQMRYALVDVLPFAGSEILVMKERFSDRDLVQALLVATEALKKHQAKHNSLLNKNRPRPVIVIDGFGEGSGWIRSPEGRKSLQRLLKWCIYITKERRLAHIVLTGNEELVIGLTDQNKMTRGHVKVIGLTDLETHEAGKIVLQEMPDASSEEVQKITDIFGGFIHDVQLVSREIQHKLTQTSRIVGGSIKKSDFRRADIIQEVISARFHSQIERILAAFAKGKDEMEAAHVEKSEEEEDGDELDSYLDPLKEVYSEAQASQKDQLDTAFLSEEASWTQLQLWHTVQRLVASKEMSVPFRDLRDEVFDGDIRPLMALMHEDVLGFEVDNSSQNSWSWQVKPATPAIGRVFQHLVQNSSLKQRFQDIETAATCQDELEDVARRRRRLNRERQLLDTRKASILQTVELGKELSMDFLSQTMLKNIYSNLVSEVVANEKSITQLMEEHSLLERAAHKQDPENKESTPKAKGLVRNTTTATILKESIRDQLEKVVLQSVGNENAYDSSSPKYHKLFEKLSPTGRGVTPSDIVRLAKETTGETLDIADAKSFVRAWDDNKNDVLDYDEFVRMISRAKKRVPKKEK